MAIQIEKKRRRRRKEEFVMDANRLQSIGCCGGDNDDEQQRINNELMQQNAAKFATSIVQKMMLDNSLSVDDKLAKNEYVIPLSNDRRSMINSCITTDKSTRTNLLLATSAIFNKNHCHISTNQSKCQKRKLLSQTSSCWPKNQHSKSESISLLLRSSSSLLFLSIVAFLTLIVIPTNTLNLIQFTEASGTTNNILNNNNNQPQPQRSSQQPNFSGSGNNGGNSVIVAPATGKARYRTLYACEDRQLTIDCEFGSKINLIRANYGRFSIAQCNDLGVLELATDCMSPITVRIMRERCQEKQKCSINATSSIFGDKCPKTPKYLEVHFQCLPDQRQQQQQQSHQLNNNNNFHEPPDRVDLRNSSYLAQSPNSHMVYPSMQTPQISLSNSGVSSILPPNNPTASGQQQQPQNARSSTSNTHLSTNNQLDATESTVQQQQQQQQQKQQQQPMTVMNSEILSYQAVAQDSRNFNLNSNTTGQLAVEQPIVVTLRHTYTENMSNPRCVLWDQTASQWTERGSQIIDTNSTHTTCAFEQATSYLLIMDYSAPTNQMISSNSNSNNNNYNNNNNLSGQQQVASTHQLISNNNLQQQQQQQPLATQINSLNPQIGSPFPGILELQPVVLQEGQSVQDALSNSRLNQQQQQQQQSSSMLRFFSAFGYLLAFALVALICVTVIFVASNMRASAGAALKSLGNFSAFSGSAGAKYKGRGARGLDDSLHGNKDLLVINNQNGHQFLYAPASATKINGSNSTHILANGSVLPASGANHHLHQIQQQQQQHQQQQQQLYSGNGTLSNLSGTGAQSNNYYYGLMGFNSLFQQQQQQQQQQQLHLQQQFNQQHQLHPQNQAATMQAASYQHQANKSTISNESANSTPSSSGVESGASASIQQQQQNCLMMNNDYSLMGQQQQQQMSGAGHYGQHQLLPATAHHQQQPQLTLNAHYSPSGGPMGNLMSSNPLALSQQQSAHHRLLSTSSQATREHIYECVEGDDKLYGDSTREAFLLSATGSDQLMFSSNTLGQSIQQQQQASNNRAAMTLSSRMFQQPLISGINNLQQQQQSANNKRLFSHPAIVRDNQTKTNIICSKLAQVAPQRATEIMGSSQSSKQSSGFQHEVMAIYNSSTDCTTTTTTGQSANSASTCYGDQLNALTAASSAKVSTDC